MPSLNRAALEELRERLTRRDLAACDPVGFLYRYPEPADREIAGLVAASLAYGRVARILTSVAGVLEPMGASPARFLRQATAATLLRHFGGFRHRFTSGDNLCGLLLGAKAAAERFGSLEAAFAVGLSEEDETVIPALTAFAERLRAAAGSECSHFLAAPARGSACKRLNLFLRWMVRQDAVDPGGWSRVAARQLVVPLDVHMHRIGLALRLTRRPQADLKAALETTAGYRTVSPEDPVRYDFALARLGMAGGLELGAFLERCRSR